MKKGIISLLLVFLALPIVAQGEARTLLERTAEAVRKAGGIHADFTVKSGGAVLSKGTIDLLGDSFVLDTHDAVTWFNGETQWTYLPSADEVTVSHPTQEELQSINPYAWLSLYRHGDKAVQVPCNDASRYRISLTEEKKGSLQQITLDISRQTLLPLRVVLKPQGGETLEIVITACQTGRKFAKEFFSFNPKRYPKAEVIDLR